MTCLVAGMYICTLFCCRDMHYLFGMAYLTLGYPMIYLAAGIAIGDSKLIKKLVPKDMNPRPPNVNVNALPIG